MRRHRTFALVLAAAALGGGGSPTALADASGEHSCSRIFPTIYLVADQRPALDVVDIYLSDACPGRVHDWTAAQRLTADTIQQVGTKALTSLRPVCGKLNTRCTNGWPDEDCVRIPPAFVEPMASAACPPREFPIVRTPAQSAGGVLRLPNADSDGNVTDCRAPVVSVDAQGRRTIAGLRLAGCSASIRNPSARSVYTFGGSALLFSDGFFDAKSFAAPHVASRLQGTADAAGRVHGMGFPLSDLLRHWTYAYRVRIDLPSQLSGVER
ncbi:hypothetical protein [Thalassobaculum sp.]|uniref:hypothetical protein n=1 Tax=Thalassobaculum sp. TaxID=2022740 RepID=UPI0032EEC752